MVEAALCDFMAWREEKESIDPSQPNAATASQCADFYLNLCILELEMALQQTKDKTIIRPASGLVVIRQLYQTMAELPASALDGKCETTSLDMIKQIVREWEAHYRRNINEIVAVLVATECPICLVDMNDATIYLGCCNKLLCEDCYRKLPSPVSCPLCRANLTTLITIGMTADP